MPLNWCFSTLGCPELDFESAAALAATFGFSSIEVRVLENRLDLPAYLEAKYGSPSQLASIIQNAPVSVSGLNTSLRLTSESDADRDAFMKYAYWASGAGIPTLRVFDGGAECDLVDTETLDQMCQNLDWWERVRTAEGFQSELLVETHWSLWTPESVLKLVEVVPCEIRFIWDVFHTWRHGGRDVLETWELLKPYIAHIHFKDAVLDPTSPKGARHLPLGEGELPLAALFSRLKSDGFSGPVSLEWERYWNPSVAPLDTMLQQGKALRFW
ncbi:sugar phosphate isomerase/epimerase [Coraliomargarita sp. SDUM461004]|uniref:Sugar phosphate isomerase/epimerase n=1 Tax=Thalassobacterium sedimentorum TaxID=3041258 RepID=A0ABU1AIW6_9BACT|nr:sugar phosphate isomerase/epimerase family protein [Coraliomargarita sp. SDUM461004]MDQ8194684.1 sugar phosphate isomerase/epimerase [Coraliomargarita sp. SDUM461004]